MLLLVCSAAPVTKDTPFPGIIIRSPFAVNDNLIQTVQGKMGM
jgi:hypothetical protein